MKAVHLTLAILALTTAAYGQKLGRLHFPDPPEQSAGSDITVDLTLLDDSAPPAEEPAATHSDADQPPPEPEADQPTPEEEPVRVSPGPNLAALDEAAGDPQRGVEVSVSSVAGELGELDPAQVSVKAPFPAKPLTPAPAGWKLVPNEDPDASFERDVEITPGSHLKLTIRPHLLVPDANGATSFAVTEPGFDPSLQYRQTETVGSLLGESIRHLKEDDARMDQAIRRLEQLLVSLPDPGTMKIDPIPTICLTALTLMTGAVISHWMGIDERVDLARLRAGQPLVSPTPEQIDTAAPALPAEPRYAAAHNPLPSHPAPADPEISPDLGQRFVRALESFEQLQRENRNLRDQVAETNRDMMELQFRVDTHSRSFRPLRATHEPQQPVGPGVLPPLESP